MNKLPEQIIIDILKTTMLLSDDRIFLSNQNFKLPPDKDLFVVVGMTSSKTYGSTSNLFEVVSPPALYERREVLMRKDIQIDLLSRSIEALTRQDEVIAALSSFYSIQQQEANYFKIFKIPETMNNLSGAEGGSNINRISVTVPLLSWYRKDIPITSGDYYDTFKQRVDDEKTIGTVKGIIEFQIDSTGIT